MALLLLASVAGWFAANNEFVETVNEQTANGYSWNQIQCRQVTPGLPAITIDTPTGKQLVCHKLQK